MPHRHVKLANLAKLAKHDKAGSTWPNLVRGNVPADVEKGGAALLALRLWHPQSRAISRGVAASRKVDAGKIAFHAGKMEIERRRVRDIAGRELTLPSWEHATGEDWLGRWAMNPMLLNVSTRKFRRAVRLPEADVPAPTGSGCRSRRFVALSSARLREWLGADLRSSISWSYRSTAFAYRQPDCART